MPWEQQEASSGDLAQSIVEEFINILESGESLGGQICHSVAGLKKRRAFAQRQQCRKRCDMLYP